VRARYLIDKSALARMPLESVRARLAPILEAGQAATCSLIDLEVLYSARNAQEHEKIRQRRRLAYDAVPMTEAIFQRAIDVQAQLAHRSQHRLPIPDLLIAAAAEAAGLIVLHYDRDFDRIAAVTGQMVEWVVAPGSL
jgi:predicted nucleic acid-binding protein